MLAVMHSHGSITAEMHEAALQFHAVVLTGSHPVLLLLGSLGIPADPCLVHVLGLGWPLLHWARHGWQGHRLVDHIETRPPQPEPSAADRLDNLRSLCVSHDAQIKEHKRGRGARPVVKGCDVDGWPLGDVKSTTME
jgi:hypothetical protein